MQMETPAMTQGSELIKYYTSGTGIPAAYAQYSPHIVGPPEGSELTEEWEFFLGLAKRMSLELWFVNFFGVGTTSHQRFKRPHRTGRGTT